jgi:hypothetical protein
MSLVALGVGKVQIGGWPAEPYAWNAPVVIAAMHEVAVAKYQATVPREGRDPSRITISTRLPHKKV